MVFISDRTKLYGSAAIGIVVPWILTLIFAIIQEIENPNIFFYQFTLTLDIPFIGKGYWFPFIAWSIAGLCAGFFNNNPKLVIKADLLAIGFNFLMYLGFVFMIGGLTAADIDPMIDPILYGQFSFTGILILILQICVRSMALPAMLLFSIFGKRMLYGDEGTPPKVITVSAEKYVSRKLSASPSLKAYEENLAKGDVKGIPASPIAPPQKPTTAKFASPTAPSEPTEKLFPSPTAPKEQPDNQDSDLDWDEGEEEK